MLFNACNVFQHVQKIEIVFVYNADAGWLNALKDYLHKIFRPSTYPCRLCAITYSNTGMKRSWRSFVKRLGHVVTFLHRDEFIERFPNAGNDFPSAHVVRGKEVELLVSSQEMNELDSVEELINLISEKLESLS